MGKAYAVTATEKEVRQTIEQWRTYLEIKYDAAPAVGRRGIVGSKFVPDNKMPPFETRTVMFSLVEGIASELGELGKLVSAKRPHVYVEGVRDPRNTAFDRAVFFDELYAGAYSPMVKNPGRTVPYNLFGHVGSSDYFLLHIYSANDFDGGGKFFESTDVADVIIFKDLAGSHKSMTVRGGWRTFKRVPFAGSIYIDKHPHIAPSTSDEMEIVHSGLAHAVSELSKL